MNSSKLITNNKLWLKFIGYHTIMSCFIYIYIYIYICVCVCVCVYIYIYIYIYTLVFVFLFDVRVAGWWWYTHTHNLTIMYYGAVERQLHSYTGPPAFHMCRTITFNKFFSIYRLLHVFLEKNQQRIVFCLLSAISWWIK